jgi:hypothetical protein
MLAPAALHLATQRTGSMSSFTTYLIGFVILIIGLAIAAFLLNVPTQWIIVGVIVLLGLGILMATSRTKTRDTNLHPPQPPQPPRPDYPPGGGYPPSSYPQGGSSGQGGYPPPGPGAPPTGGGPGGPPPGRY